MTDTAEQRGEQMLKMLSSENIEHVLDELDSTVPAEAPSKAASIISIHPAGPLVQAPRTVITTNNQHAQRSAYYDAPLDNIRGRGRGRGRNRRNRWRGRGRHVQNFVPFPNTAVPYNLQNFVADTPSINSHIGAPIGQSSPQQGNKNIV